MQTMKQSGLWSSLGTHGNLVVIWWLCISSSGEARKFDSLGQIWPWRPRSIAPKTIGISTNVFWTSGPNLVILAWMGDELWCGQAQNGVIFLLWPYIWPSPPPPPPKKKKSNKDLQLGVLHPCSKFGDPSLNGWRVIARTNLVTDGRTDGRRQQQYPEAKTGLG